MTTERPGFRPAKPVHPADSNETRLDSSAVGSPGPFTQGQIAHLMKTEFARARRHDYAMACVVIRVDRLRALSEAHGSGVRTEVKRLVAQAVDRTTRGHDYLGSMADGAYLLVLPHTGGADAQAVAERIRTSFQAMEIEVDGRTIGMTLSVGVAAATDDRDTMFFETLISQAEVALDWAARGGGDQVVLFERERFVKPST